MSNNYDEVTTLVNAGWHIEAIDKSDDGKYCVVVEDEGEVNNFPKYKDGTVTMEVNKEEAEKLAHDYGIMIS
ncbi:MAG: hypothetical protein IKN12_12725 [Selenomonadaceae bacterium]|nr:hypothetical protein [Selenomonadaceae bacterium]